MTVRPRISCARTATGWRCGVTVGDDPGSTSHVVTVSDAVLERLAPRGPAADDARRAEALVLASFEFLLEREPRESILRTFDLPVIERYFPGYEDAIRGRVATDLQEDEPGEADRP